MRCGCDCERAIMIRLGKVNCIFWRLGRIWASKSIAISDKVQLYEALILAVLLYGAETWPKLRNWRQHKTGGFVRSYISHGEIK